MTHYLEFRITASVAISWSTATTATTFTIVTTITWSIVAIITITWLSNITICLRITSTASTFSSFLNNDVISMTHTYNPLYEDLTRDRRTEKLIHNRFREKNWKSGPMRINNYGRLTPGQRSLGWTAIHGRTRWLIPDESPVKMSETYSCLFLFDIELKFIKEDIIFILKGFTSCFFFCECDESKTSSRSSGVTQVHSYMFHLTEFTKNGLVNQLDQLPWIPGRS